MSSVLENRTDSRLTAITAIVRKRATAIGCKSYQVEAAILAALSAYTVGRHSAFRSIKRGLKQAMSIMRLSAATPHEQALAIIRMKAIRRVEEVLPIYRTAFPGDERLNIALDIGSDYAMGLCDEKRLTLAIQAAEDVYDAARAQQSVAADACRLDAALHVVEAALYALDPVIDYPSINRCVRAAKEFSL